MNSYKESPGGYERVNELQLGRIPLLVRRSGRAIKEENPFRYGTAGVVAHKLRFGMRFETWCVSDHPVCAFKGGFAAFF
jgi:hypothetical protein